MRMLGVVLVMVCLAACGGRPEVAARGAGEMSLHQGESLALRQLIDRSAAEHGIPPALLHRVIQRESGYRPHARNGPYWGLMQIMPQTARTMGHSGPPEELLDPAVNLRYAGRYLRGAWIVSRGNMDRAVHWYASGYYYEARDRCLLVETGLAAREVNRRCRNG